MAYIKTNFSGKFTDFYLEALRKEVEKKKPPKNVDIRETKGSEGFGIRVRPTGVITFFYMYHFDGRRRMLILGSYNSSRNEVTLSEARQKYNNAYSQVHALKRDPMATPVKNTEEGLTVSQVTMEFLEKHSAEYYAPRWHDNIKSVMEKYVLPDMGERPIISIRRKELINLLVNLTKTIPGQARNLHKAISKMFWYAQDREYIDNSPYTKMLDSVPKLRTPAGRKRYLDDNEIRKIWHRIDRGPGEDSVKRALKMILVTGQRPEEVVRMHRNEINERWWTIPWQRIKTENKKTLRRSPEDHRVYLTDLAVSLLGKSNGFIFPSLAISRDELGNKVIRERPLTRGALSQRVMRGMSLERSKGNIICFPYYGRERWTPHDLRRSLSSGMGRIEVPSEWTEEVLNHKKEKVRAVYDHHNYDEQKLKALTLWSSHLEKIVGIEELQSAIRQGVESGGAST